MRLAIKGSLAFLVLYVVILGAVALWIEFYLQSVADDMMDRTAWLIGSEIARTVSDSATEQLLKEDAHTRKKLVDIVDDVTEHSQVVASLAVVDDMGKVVASDGIEVGHQLAIPKAIFHQGGGKPQAFKVHLAGGDYHLFVPLLDQNAQVMGYVRLGLRSRRISKLYYSARRELLVAAATGLLAVILIGWILHVQLSKRSDALIHALSGAAGGEDVRFSSRDEFASALATARRVGQELTAAREEKSHAHRRLGALMKAMNVGVLLLGKGKDLDFANPPARELFGCPEPEELERRWPEISARLDGVLKEEQVSRQVDVDVPVNGETRRLRLELYRLDEPDAEGYLVLVKNRDSLSALEKELGLAMQMRGLARFYKAFAHDLKAPLNAMVMNLELLKETLREQDGEDPRHESSTQVRRGHPAGAVAPRPPASHSAESRRADERRGRADRPVRAHRQPRRSAHSPGQAAAGELDDGRPRARDPLHRTSRPPEAGDAQHRDQRARGHAERREPVDRSRPRGRARGDSGERRRPGHPPGGVGEGLRNAFHHQERRHRGRSVRRPLGGGIAGRQDPGGKRAG